MRSTFRSRHSISPKSTSTGTPLDIFTCKIEKYHDDNKSNLLNILTKYQVEYSYRFRAFYSLRLSNLPNNKSRGITGCWLISSAIGKIIGSSLRTPYILSLILSLAVFFEKRTRFLLIEDKILKKKSLCFRTRYFPHILTTFPPFYSNEIDEARVRSHLFFLPFLVVLLGMDNAGKIEAIFF